MILLIQIAYCVAHDVELYFAFEDDKVIICCLFEVQATSALFIILIENNFLNTYSPVLFLSSYGPA